LDTITSRNPGKNQSGVGSSLNRLVSAGSISYQRRLHLQQLLPISLMKIDDRSLQNRRWIISRLATALRQERNRGRCGHWAYSLNRHVALLQAYRAERKLSENLND